MSETLTLEIDARDLRYVQARAAELGLTPEQWALATVKLALANSDVYRAAEGVDPDWAIDLRIAQETDENGGGTPVDEAFAALNERLESRLAKTA